MGRGVPETRGQGGPDAAPMAGPVTRTGGGGWGGTAARGRFNVAGPKWVPERAGRSPEPEGSARPGAMAQSLEGLLRGLCDFRDRRLVATPRHAGTVVRTLVPREAFARATPWQDRAAAAVEPVAVGASIRDKDILALCSKSARPPSQAFAPAHLQGCWVGFPTAPLRGPSSPVRRARRCQLG